MLAIPFGSLRAAAHLVPWLAVQAVQEAVKCYSKNPYLAICRPSPWWICHRSDHAQLQWHCGTPVSHLHRCGRHGKTWQSKIKRNVAHYLVHVKWRWSHAKRRSGKCQDRADSRSPPTQVVLADIHNCPLSVLAVDVLCPKADKTMYLICCLEVDLNRPHRFRSGALLVSL